MTTIKELNKKIQQLQHTIKKQEQIITKNNPMDAVNPLLDAIAGIHWSKNKEGRYLSCNDLMVRTLGLKQKSDIVGKTDFELPWAEQAHSLVQNDLEVMREGKIQEGKEELVKTPDGIIHTFMVTKCPLKNDCGEIIGTFGCSVDISHIKALEMELVTEKEKAEAASLAKSKFIANMSHDIRTPLTGIVGLSDILLDTVIKQESKNYAKMLSLSGEQLLSLLNSVLEVVSSESINQDEVQITAFSIVDLLQNLFELQLPALKLKNLTLDLTMDEHIPQVIKSDKGKLYRILLNLISNSIKFTEDGGITLSVRHKDNKDSQGTLLIKILDTGIGIPKTETDKIFNPFYRVHPSYEGKYLGFGVGLHLVKRYMDALGGEISVKSIEGMGTTFYLTIPVEVADQEPAVNTQDKKQALEKTIDDINQPNEPKQAIESTTPQADLTNPQEIDSNQVTAHVLLVEDNPMAMKVAEMILSKLGATTDKAFNSHDALSLFKKNHYDFVITDIGLPDYSGFELAQKIKAFENEHNQTSPTPIIGLTAHAKQEALLQGNQCGMIEVCEKPLTNKSTQSYIDMFGKNTTAQSSASDKSTQSPNQDVPLLDVDLGVSQLGSIEDLKEMLDIMLKQSMVVTVNEIDGFFQDNDWESFKKQLHKFKSSCLYCATTKLLTFTQELEALSDTKDINQIKPVYQKFCDCVISTHQYIESWLSIDK